MARRPSPQPTPAELEILKVLWETGPATVRQVMQRLAGDRAYTTIMTLMNVMHEKGLLRRRPAGKAFIYRPTVQREMTLRAMLADMVERAFEGSASALVAHLLQEANPDERELAEIRRLIEKNKSQ